jgi:hypothetical protein
MDFEEAMSALQGMVGEVVNVMVQVKLSGTPFPCAHMKGPLSRAVETGWPPGLAGSIYFVVAPVGAEYHAGFLLTPAQFNGAGWVEHGGRSSLFIRQASVDLVIGRGDTYS